MLEQIKKRRVDWVIVGCVILLSLYGLLAVYSATNSSDSVQIRENFDRQLVWIVLGLIIGAIITFIPTVWFISLSTTLYALLLLTLFVLELFGRSGDANRWLALGGIKFQPSELMKPVLVLTLARFLNEESNSPNRLGKLALSFLLVLVPFALVLKQPDLGTSLTLIVILIPMLFWRGLNPFTIFVLCSPILTFISSFIFWTFFIVILILSIVLYYSRRGNLVFWSVFLLNISVGILAPILWGKLHEYQQQRILTFLGLVSDPQGVGYQIIQSKVAIGSGGLIGKGLLQGTQTQLRFLPAQHTDFIFSVLAEEWGFIGSLLVLITFFILFYRGIRIAASTNYRFASLVVIGLVTIIAFQTIVNLGMTMGIMPVTGIPLPFISYGGSAMITNMIMVGMIANVSLQRFKYS
jgi:rod shape determining protein RodA